jgi:hypothetical protein
MAVRGGPICCGRAGSRTFHKHGVVGTDSGRWADPQYGGSLAGAVAGAYHLLNGYCDADTAHRLLVDAIAALPDPTDAQNKTLIEALSHC